MSDLRIHEAFRRSMNHERSHRGWRGSGALAVGALAALLGATSGCDTMAEDGLTADDAQEMIDTLNAVGTESKLQTVLGDPLTGEVVDIQLDPPHAPFDSDSIASSTIPDVLEGPIEQLVIDGSGLDPDDPVQADILVYIIDDLVPDMVQTASDQLHKSVITMLDEGWDDLSIADSESFDFEDWPCWGEIEYEISLEEFDGLSFEIADLTFDFVEEDSALGVVGLAPDVWLVLEQQTVHLAALHDRTLGSVTFVDETLGSDEVACWRFQLATTAADALAAAIRLNEAGPVAIELPEPAGDDDDDDDSAVGDDDDGGACACAQGEPAPGELVVPILLMGLWLTGRVRRSRSARSGAACGRTRMPRP
ncbi:MAG: hypothetical protein QGH45_01450 [Myxococcota bacterium]|jgi:hypothetical protein|nr:hypothetical protein [Myxococcota bacterium]